MTQPLLALSDTTRVYPGPPPVHALRSATFDVDSGDYVTITGPSGAGKSTLLNIIGLLDTPSSGSYRVRGMETVGARERLRVAIRRQLFGFVFQAFHLMPGRSALENVEIGMLYGPVPRQRRRGRALDAIEKVGLTQRLDADPRVLSGGERQRIAIARAIACGPDLLICDEPTGNLDSANTTKVMDLLSDLHQSGLTIIVVTHDESVAAHARRRLSVIDGAVIEVTEDE